MTWTPIEPQVSDTTQVVTLTVNAPGKTDRKVGHVATIMVRADKIADGLEFWRVGSEVSVYVGQGEHAGMIRVTPGRGHVLKKVSGRTTDARVACLRLRGIRNLPMQGLKSTPLEYEYNRDWLEATLPASIAPRPTPPGRPIVEENSSLQPPGPPYRGIAAKTGLGKGVGVSTKAP